MPETQIVSNKKEEFAKVVCLFLAEQLRIRDITLSRAAEISKKVLQHINLLDQESDFLKLIQELAKDFEELHKLEKRVFFYMEEDQRKTMESHVKDFVIHILTQDMQLALQIMERTIKEGSDLSSLTNQFPKFKEFMEESKEENETERLQGAEMLENPPDGSFLHGLQAFVAWVTNLLAGKK